jgi:hypothetical protein
MQMEAEELQNIAAILAAKDKGLPSLGPITKRSSKNRLNVRGQD